MYLTHVPSPPLREFIDSFWLYESSGPEHQFDRILPTSDVNLIINLRDNRCTVQNGASEISYEGTILAGPFSHSFVIDTTQQCRTIGVNFRPARAVAFLDLPAEEL